MVSCASRTSATGGSTRRGCRCRWRASAHAQERSNEACAALIAVYVNSCSLDVGEEGLRAIERLVAERPGACDARQQFAAAACRQPRGRDSASCGIRLGARFLTTSRRCRAGQATIGRPFAWICGEHSAATDCPRNVDVDARDCASIVPARLRAGVAIAPGAG